MRVNTPESLISSSEDSPPLIEKVRLSLSASVAVRVATACWFSGTVNDPLDVITGSLSLILLIDTYTSWDVVFKSSLKLTLTR